MLARIKAPDRAKHFSVLKVNEVCQAVVESHPQKNTDQQIALVMEFLTRDAASDCGAEGKKPFYTVAIWHGLGFGDEELYLHNSSDCMDAYSKFIDAERDHGLDAFLEVGFWYEN